MTQSCRGNGRNTTSVDSRKSSAKNLSEPIGNPSEPFGGRESPAGLLEPFSDLSGPFWGAKNDKKGCTTVPPSNCVHIHRKIEWLNKCMSVVVSPKIASTPLHQDISTLQGTMPLRQAEVETTVHPERVYTNPPNRPHGTPKENKNS